MFATLVLDKQNKKWILRKTHIQYIFLLNTNFLLTCRNGSGLDRCRPDPSLCYPRPAWPTTRHRQWSSLIFLCWSITFVCVNVIWVGNDCTVYNVKRPRKAAQLLTLVVKIDRRTQKIRSTIKNCSDFTHCTRAAYYVTIAILHVAGTRPHHKLSEVRLNHILSKPTSHEFGKKRGKRLKCWGRVKSGVKLTLPEGCGWDYAASGGFAYTATKCNFFLH